MAGRRKQPLSAEQRRQRKNAAQRAYRARHKKKINAKLRRKWATDPDFRARRVATHRKKKYWLQTLYGISLQDRERMRAQQRGRCAICGRKSKQELCVDHDHVREIVRALLCQPCNRGLGFFDEDPIRLLRAAAYLLDFEAKFGRASARRRALSDAALTIGKLAKELWPLLRHSRQLQRLARMKRSRGLIARSRDRGQARSPDGAKRHPGQPRRAAEPPRVSLRPPALKLRRAWCKARQSLGDGGRSTRATAMPPAAQTGSGKNARAASSVGARPCARRRGARPSAQAAPSGIPGASRAGARAGQSPARTRGAPRSRRRDD